MILNKVAKTAKPYIPGFALIKKALVDSNLGEILI
jgi:hypothetical protein